MASDAKMEIFYLLRCSKIRLNDIVTPLVFLQLNLKKTFFQARERLVKAEQS